MKRFAIVFALSCVLILGMSLGVAAQAPSGELSATRLISGLEGGAGSTVGPDGALYVTENAAGRIARVDPKTGEKTVLASGLPKMITAVGIGGIMDVAFMNGTAYALVTLVSADVGGKDIDGIYRIDGPEKFTVIADIGKFSIDHPPVPAFQVPTGVQYAMEGYEGNFIVTDGHHNRVLKVTADGNVSELIAFDDIVPTGLEVSASSNTIYDDRGRSRPASSRNGQGDGVRAGIVHGYTGSVWRAPAG